MTHLNGQLNCYYFNYDDDGTMSDTQYRLFVSMQYFVTLIYLLALTLALINIWKILIK